MTLIYINPVGWFCCSDCGYKSVDKISICPRCGLTHEEETNEPNKNKYYKRFKITQKGYKYDKRIFQLISLLVAIHMATAIYLEGGFTTKIYVACHQEQPCLNPFYTEPGLINPLPQKYLNKCTMDWCNNKYLEPGFEYGTPNKKILSTLAWPFTILILITGFILNHLLYNKGKKIDLGLNNEND